MARFYVTFGQRYAQETHPTFPEAHPDGFITVDAASFAEATAMATDFLSGRWSGVYPGEPPTGMYPRGCLALLTSRPDGAEALTGEADDAR